MVSFKGAHFAKDIILVGVRWYVAYPLSYRHVEELMEERGVEVNHSEERNFKRTFLPAPLGTIPSSPECPCQPPAGAAVGGARSEREGAGYNHGAN